MKKYFYAVIAVCFLACNSETKDSTTKKSSSDTTKAATTADANNAVTGCGNSILFKEGTIVEASNYDGAGKETGKSISTVLKVSEDGGMTMAEMESKTTRDNDKDEKTVHPIYKCDGQNFIVDIADLLRNEKQDVSIEGSGITFPLTVSVGETLPVVNYIMKMKTGEQTMTINSTIKDRKVEAKESLTVSGQSIETYKISSVVDASVDIPGMNDLMKKSMEEAKKNMGQSKMIIWYAPNLTVLKMDFYMGDKLINRNVVTAIKSK